MTLYTPDKAIHLPSTEHIHEAYRPVPLVSTRAAIRSSINGLLTLDNHREHMRSREEGITEKSSTFKPKFPTNASAVGIASLMPLSFLRLCSRANDGQRERGR